MKTRIIILLSIITNILLGCNSTNDQQKTDNLLKKNILGDWELIFKREVSAIDFPPPPPFSLPQGMKISNDSIEFYIGFYKKVYDSITGESSGLYLGNVVPYKIDNGTIIIKSLLTENWESKWKFVSRKNDTLQLAINDSTTILYKKLSYNLDTLPDFDQIIYSSSGCYGTCPIIDISITNEGNVLFQGERYVKSLGIYSGNLDTKTTNYIFDKFRQANPLRLQDYYSVLHSDDVNITTSFIQKGKIVKTIHDYGMAGTKELIWAYIPISNIHDINKLDSLTLDEPFYPKQHFYAFEKNGLILPLEKCVSFYLWTELIKSKNTDEPFKPKYKLIFRSNFTYEGPDQNKNRQLKDEIKSVITDGQFFKFEFKNNKSVTYDLGYNFIERNFKWTQFR